MGSQKQKGRHRTFSRETARAVTLKQRPVLVVVCEDITEQKHAGEALTRSEAHLAGQDTKPHG